MRVIAKLCLMLLWVHIVPGNTQFAIGADFLSHGMVFTSEQLRAGHYQDLFDLLGTLPGIHADGNLMDRPSINGADWRDVLVVVDGVEMTDPLTDWPFLHVPMGSIERIAIYPNGFSTQYGAAHGALIDITTKHGSKTLKVNADVRASLATRKHFGPMMYSADSPLVQPFVDEQAGAFTGNDIFMGWNHYAASLDSGYWDADDQVWRGDYHFNKPYEAYALYLWRHRSPDNLAKLYELAESGRVDLDLSKIREADAFFDYAQQPDWTGDISLSGPIPWTAGTFFFNFLNEERAYATRVQGENFRNAGLFTRLDIPFTENGRIRAGYHWSQQTGLGGISGPNLFDPISRNPFDVERLSNRIWYPVAGTPAQHTRHVSFLSFSKKVSTVFEYDFRLSQTQIGYEMQQSIRHTYPIPTHEWGMTHLKYGVIGREEQADFRAQNPTSIDDEPWVNWRDWAKIRIGGVWYDEAPYGFDPILFRDASTYFRMASAEFKVNSSWSRIHELGFNVNYTLNRHQFKAGFSYGMETIRGKFYNLQVHI